MRASEIWRDDSPVDMVFTYVDGSDPAHVVKRRRFEPLYAVSEIRRDTPADRNPEARHVDVGEIVFGVNSVLKFIPWVRTVYIVTDDQVPPLPENLVASGRVRIVDHSDIIPARYLPTFSSRVVESFLHRIPGLSEIFLYNNDDYIHFAPVGRGVFCDAAPDGSARLNLHVNQAVAHRMVHALSRILPRGERIANLHLVGISNAYALLRRCRHGVAAHEVIVPRHSTQVIRKATAGRLEDEFGDALDANRQLRFRSARGFSHATLLYTMERKWNPFDRVSRSLRWSASRQFRMFDFTGFLSSGDSRGLWRRVARSRVQFACLNNIPVAERERLAEVMREKGLQ